MTNFVILNVQALMGLAAYFLVYWVFLRPWLQSQPFERAVLPLLIVNVFRFLGLTFLVTGQLDPSLSRGALELIAYGDFAAAICALLAALALTAGSRLATPLVALFSVVGIADLMMVFPTALGAGVFEASMGAMWLTVGLFAPVIVLSHVYVAYRLALHLRGRSTAVLAGVPA
ncbi:MAG: hypothetical protein Rubg2KO_24020 [Rubricoccaceae bacterium]